MCEANAYIYQNGKEELYLESVDIMRPEEGENLSQRISSENRRSLTER